MLRIKSFALLLCALVAPIFVGCEPVETTPGEEPIVVLDTYELNVDGGGGNVPIYYAVQNAIRGVKPKAKSNVEWITIKEITSGTIVLSIQASNVDEERLGIVTITYEGMAKGVRVSVLQDRQFLDKFSFEVLDVTHSSCSVKYVPKSSGTYFMANIIDADYFTQSGITDMSIFVQNEMASYLAIAEQYGITLQYLLEEAVSPQLLFKEEVTRSFGGMQPGATYMAYAYGLELKDNEYTVTIPLHHTYIDLPMSPFYDVTFNVVSQMTSGGVANVVVTPVGWNGYYSVTIVPDSSLFYVPEGERMSEYTLRAMGNDFYKRARKAVQSGLTVDAFLRSNCHVGSKSFNMSVSGGSKYMVVVFAVESKDGDIPVMCSVPVISYL